MTSFTPKEVMDKVNSTNFHDSAMVNDLVGNKANAGWLAGDHQLDIIQSEWDELRSGVHERDIHETRDGIADVLFTVYGLAHRLGLDADAGYEDMMVSQMTKFDTTEEDAAITRDKYERKGMSVETVERYHPRTGELLYVTLSSENQQDDKGRFCPKGKWLKSHNFEEPVFRPLPQEVENQLTGVLASWEASVLKDPEEGGVATHQVLYRVERITPELVVEVPSSKAYVKDGEVNFIGDGVEFEDEEHHKNYRYLLEKLAVNFPEGRPVHVRLTHVEEPIKR